MMITSWVEEAEGEAGDDLLYDGLLCASSRVLQSWQYVLGGQTRPFQQWKMEVIRNGP